MSTMIRKIFLFLSIFDFLVLGAGCGGGSSGTGFGPPSGGKSSKFTGIVIDQNGRELSFTQVTLLNTNESVTSDEAGVFELETDFPGGEATLEIQPNNEASASVVVPNELTEIKNTEISIIFDAVQDSAELQAITLRANVVRNCSPLFLNARTIYQTSPILEGMQCTIDVQIRSNGLPVDGLVFQLQRRGCSAGEQWQFVSAQTTGTSGPGNGEIEFKYSNDEAHCVYRIQGPLDLKGVIPVSAQIFTQRKQKFDRDSGK